MAWNVDRLGRSLKEPVAFLSELHALGIDLFLHQQGLEGPRREARPCFRCSDQRARRAVELGDEVAGKALHHRCDKLRADAVPSLLSPPMRPVRQSFQNPSNRSERSSVYRTVCMMLRWPRKCCSARVSTPSLANLKPQAWRSMCG
jgi:hypothetical protein